MTKIDLGDLIVAERPAQFGDDERIIHFEHCPLEEDVFNSEGQLLVTFDKDGNATGEIVDCRFWLGEMPIDWNDVPRAYTIDLVENVLIKGGY